MGPLQPFKPLLYQGGGILLILPDADGGAARQRHLQHQLHKFVDLLPVGGGDDVVILNLRHDLRSPVRHVRLSFHGYFR